MNYSQSSNIYESYLCILEKMSSTWSPKEKRNHFCKIGLIINTIFKTVEIFSVFFFLLFLFLFLYVNNLRWLTFPPGIRGRSRQLRRRGQKKQLGESNIAPYPQRMNILPIIAQYHSKDDYLQKLSKKNPRKWGGGAQHPRHLPPKKSPMEIKLLFIWRTKSTWKTRRGVAAAPRTVT